MASSLPKMAAETRALSTEVPAPAAAAATTPTATPLLTTTTEKEEANDPNNYTSSAEAYEQRHVHAVYGEIASHFSATRHSPWPLVTRFLSLQLPGSVGIDVGCGSGRYLALRGDVVLLGCDRCLELARLAAEKTVAARRGTRDPERNAAGDTALDDHDKTTAQPGLAPGSVEDASPTVRSATSAASAGGASSAGTAGLGHDMVSDRDHVDTATTAAIVTDIASAEGSQCSPGKLAAGALPVTTGVGPGMTTGTPAAGGADARLARPCCIATRDSEPPRQRDDQRAAVSTTAVASKASMSGRGTADDVLQSDILSLPFAPANADFALCIAVIHHLATRERRVAAIREVLSCLKPWAPPKGDDASPRRAVPAGAAGRSPEEEKRGTAADRGATTDTTTVATRGAAAAGSSPNSTADDLSDASRGQGGRALLYVWALEQRGSRRGWDEGVEQDQLVPWVLMPRNRRSQQPNNQEKRKRRPKEQGNEAASGSRKHPPSPSDRTMTLQPETTAATTYQRYYHLYRRGELEEDVVSAGGTVLAGGYERDNWWVVAART